MYFNRNIIGPPLCCLDPLSAMAVGTAISTGANVFSSLFGSKSSGPSSSQLHKNAMEQLAAEQKFNAEQAELARRYNTSERLAAQAYQSDEWDRQFEITSAYNSPEAQVARMRAAGLNPNALYEGADAGSASVSPLSSSGATSPMASSPSIAGSMLNYDLQRDYLSAQTSNVEANTLRQLYDLGFAKKTEEQRIAEIDANIKKTSVETNKIAHEIGWGDVDSEIQKGMYNWYSQLSSEDIKLKKEQLNLLRNQSLELLSRVEVNHKSISLMDSQIDLNYSNLANTDADTLKKYTETKVLLTEEDKIALETDLLTLEKSFSEAIGAPIGTPLYNLQFKLWKEGKLWDYCGTLAPDVSKSVLDIIGSFVKAPSKADKVFDIGASLLGRGLIP